MIKIYPEVSSGRHICQTKNEKRLSSTAPDIVISLQGGKFIRRHDLCFFTLQYPASREADKIRHGLRPIHCGQFPRQFLFADFVHIDNVSLPFDRIFAFGIKTDKISTFLGNRMGAA